MNVYLKIGAMNSSDSMCVNEFKKYLKQHLVRKSWEKFTFFYSKSLKCYGKTYLFGIFTIVSIQWFMQISWCQIRMYVYNMSLDGGFHYKRLSIKILTKSSPQMFATNTNVRFWPSNLLIIQKLIVLILKIAKFTQNFVRVNKWTKTEMKKKNINFS